MTPIPSKTPELRALLHVTLTSTAYEEFSETVVRTQRCEFKIGSDGQITARPSSVNIEIFDVAFEDGTTDRLLEEKWPYHQRGRCEK